MYSNTLQHQHVVGGVQMQHAQLLAAFMELGHTGLLTVSLSQEAARDIASQEVFGSVVAL